MFYSVVAYQRQPRYTYNDLQRRCHYSQEGGGIIGLLDYWITGLLPAVTRTASAWWPHGGFCSHHDTT